MNDYRYYASESTLQTLNNNIVDLNNNLVSYSENFLIIFITIAILLAVKFIESFLDTAFHSRK